MASNTLTFKEAKFVAEYLIDGNRTRAAVVAGYSEATASQIAYKLFRKVHVQRAIEIGQRRALLKAKVTKERIVAELAKVAFSNMNAYVDRSEGDVRLSLFDANDDEMAAVAELTVDVLTEDTEAGEDVEGEDAEPKIRKTETKSRVERTKMKLHSKLGALQELARIEGLHKDSLAVTGKDGQPLPVMVFRRQKVKPPEPEADDAEA